VLSNEKRRAFYDKHGYTEEDAENGEGAGFSGMDDLFEAMFGGGGKGMGGGGFTFTMDMGGDGDDFDEFMHMMEGND